MPEQSLALPAVGKVLDALGLSAEFAAIADPSGIAGVAGASVTTVRALISRLEEREENRQRERARLLLENLRHRVKELESGKGDPPVDLFAEMLDTAIRQDDERKVPLQGAVIAWVCAKRPDPALARLALNAVGNLGYPELRAFISWYHRHDGQLRMERGWSAGTTWARLHQAGLISQTSMVGREFVTETGRVIVDGCPRLTYSEQEAARLA